MIVPRTFVGLACAPACKDCKQEALRLALQAKRGDHPENKAGILEYASSEEKEGSNT